MTAAQIAAVAAGISAGLIVSALLWASNNLIETTRYSLETAGLEKEVRIAQVSDLHGKKFGARNIRLTEKIRREAPDFIAVTGDIIHRYTPKNIKVALETVSTLSQIAPVLYVSGNHEMRNKGYAFFRKDLKEAGAVVLDNRTVEICGISVTGLNGAHNRNGTASAIVPPSPPKVLLAHMPQFIKNYAQAGYDIVLSGHAHGGQWRIPFAKRGIFAPGQGFFPKYTAGIYEEGNTKMVVSRGLGNSEFPLRLFNRPELVILKLAPVSENSGAPEK